jgi:hypothetical protein
MGVEVDGGDAKYVKTNTAGITFALFDAASRMDVTTILSSSTLDKLHNSRDAWSNTHFVIDHPRTFDKLMLTSSMRWKTMGDRS